MRAAVLISLFLFPCILHAGEPLSDFCDRTEAFRIEFKYSYAAYGTSAAMTGSGSIRAQDSLYFMEGNGLEVWCDGISKWIVDRGEEEVVIERAGTDGDLLSDPVSLISLVRSSDVPSGKRTVRNGKPVTEYVVGTGGHACGLSEIRIAFEQVSGVPVPVYAMAVTADEMSVEFSISAFAYHEKSPVSDYVLDETSLPSSYFVTDLR